MGTRRHKDGNWQFPTNANGAIESWDHVTRALLMDLRDEAKLQTKALQSMARILECHNTQAIPHTLARIDRRLARHLPLKKATT